MSAKINYTRGPIRKIQVVADFLPPPNALAVTDESVKITISLSKRSVDFFKREPARRRPTSAPPRS